MPVKTARKDFGVRLKAGTSERLHAFVQLNGGKRNAWINQAIDFYLEEINKQKPPEVA
jgi:predicted DNA-binding protein